MANPLEYAPPATSRRRRHVVALILCAASVGIVGKLCWDKFAYPLRIHLHRLAVQSDQRLSPGIGLQRPAPNVAPSAAAVKLEEACEALTGSRNTGESFYCGPMDADGSRWITLSISRTESTPISSATLVARVFEPASFAQAPRLIGNPAILPFFTYRTGFKVDVPTRSATNPSLLLLAGTSDATPFRFELSLGSDNAVHLVEDKSAATTVPVDAQAD